MEGRPLVAIGQKAKDRIRDTVDTNLDFLDYPDNSQPTICHFRP